jgi:signal transduction histidine kinase
MDSVKQSKVSQLAKVSALLQEHEKDLGAFIAIDPKGRFLPSYLENLTKHLLASQAATIEEAELLQKNVQHIKGIVAMQQNYANVSGVKEVVDLRTLVEDSLRMDLGSLDPSGVQVARDFQEVAPINIDKHKLLQILINLLRNAKHACDESGRADKRVTVRVAKAGAGVEISVADNGVGISPENLTRIFNHGFTTRLNGHGFGLHGSALAAKGMGGSLTVHSDGPGQGTRFTLQLPLQSEEERA